MGKLRTHFGKPIRFTKCFGANDDAIDAGLFNGGAYAVFTANASAKLARKASRRDDSSHNVLIDRPPGFRTVQIDKMQSFRAFVTPAESHINRVVRKNSTVVIVALTKTDASTFKQIDCGK